METAIAERSAPITRVVRIATECGSLTAELTVAEEPVGVIVFARTNAAHRQTRYDRQLAAALHAAGFATLAFDLLTPSEELVDQTTRGLRVDLALLSRRLIEAVDWLREQSDIANLPVGLMGEGFGAAAAFVTACVRRHRIGAIVSYAQRLDLAMPVLPRVRVPSLIVVAGNDEDDLRSNDVAFRTLNCPKELVRIAIDRFTTSTATDADISRLALDWFCHMMPGCAGRQVSHSARGSIAWGGRDDTTYSDHLQ
jgi:putative phosphoribosyl transferase